MQIVSKVIKNIPITCKLIYIISFVLYVIGLFIKSVPLTLANYRNRVWRDKQIYRLFLTFFSKGQSVFSIISIFLDFLWIRYFFTKIEKNCSTAFFALQIFIQNLIIQIVFTLLCGIFVYLSYFDDFLISYGWTPLIIVFVFRLIYKDGQDNYKLLCFNIPKRYIPLTIIIFSIIFAFDQLLCILLSIFLGYLQFGIIKKHFIRLPLNLYRKIDSCMPKIILKREDYIKVQDMEQNIKEECWKHSSANTEQKDLQFTEQKGQDCSKQNRRRKLRKTGLNKRSNGQNIVQLKQGLKQKKPAKQGDTNALPEHHIVQTEDKLDQQIKI